MVVYVERKVRCAPVVVKHSQSEAVIDQVTAVESTSNFEVRDSSGLSASSWSRGGDGRRKRQTREKTQRLMQTSWVTRSIHQTSLLHV